MFMTIALKCFATLTLRCMLWGQGGETCMFLLLRVLLHNYTCISMAIASACFISLPSVSVITKCNP